MTVRVKLFAVARELAGCDELAIELADGATIADARIAVALAAPALQSVLQISLWAVDAAYAADQTAIDEHSKVALIPPVSGG